MRFGRIPANGWPAVDKATIRREAEYVDASDIVSYANVLRGIRHKEQGCGAVPPEDFTALADAAAWLRENATAFQGTVHPAVAFLPVYLYAIQ